MAKTPKLSSEKKVHQHIRASAPDVKSLIKPVNPFVLFLLLILASYYGQAQQTAIGSAALISKQSILNGRAYFSFPAEAQNIARSTSIMSADPNVNTETRIVLTVKNMKVVFFAQELFATAGDHFLAAVQKDDRDDFLSRELSKGDSLVSVLSTPLRFDSLESAILVNTLLVKTADKSVFRISAYISPESYRERDEFKKLSERVFATLSKGERKLNSRARTESWPVYEGAKKFSISLPEGYVITKDAKYDFEVLKFHKLSDFSDTSRVSLILYTGRYPSYFYPQQGFSEADAQKISGTFLGKKIEWLYFGNDAAHLYIKEQKIPFPKLGEGIILHVAMITDQANVINELSGIVDAIKLIN